MNMVIKKYNIKTKYGYTSVMSSNSKHILVNKYKNTKLKSQVIAKNILQLKNFLLDNFKVTPYGFAYLNEMETSYVMYGEKGLHTQVLYFFSNSKAITEDGKKYRQRVTKGGNPLRLA